jgi:hypothetical protein
MVMNGAGSATSVSRNLLFFRAYLRRDVRHGGGMLSCERPAFFISHHPVMFREECSSASVALTPGCENINPNHTMKKSNFLK